MRARRYGKSGNVLGGVEASGAASWGNRKVKIEQWPVDQVATYGGDPRQNEAPVEAVANSVREFGFRQATVVDAEGVIVCGHSRWKAAQSVFYGPIL